MTADSEYVLSLPLSDGDKERILGGNAREFIGL
jgi:predicted TIM-barrel fold metal-dependent hydrolase